MVGKWTLLLCTVSFLFRQSNLGIPGVWAFHIGSTSPLDNIRPATIGGDLTKAHPSPPPEQSFRPEAALESDYTEDNLDYYDENEGEVESPRVNLRKHGMATAVLTFPSRRRLSWDLEEVGYLHRILFQPPLCRRI